MTALPASPSRHPLNDPSYPSLFGGQLRICEEMGQIGVQQPNSASFSPPPKKATSEPSFVVVTEVAYPHMTWDFY